jgi:hypothetical protein
LDVANLTFSGSSFEVSGALHVSSSDDSYFIGGGNVGIGVTNPSAKLEIKQAAYTSVDGIMIVDPALSSGRMYMSSDHDFILQKGTNDNQLVLDAGGNVGIGTTAPAATLDVNGDIEVQGDLFFQNSAVSIDRNSNALRLRSYDG